MYSKRPLLAIAGLVLCASCSMVRLPWSAEPVGQEVNLAFTVNNNLLFLSSAIVDGRAGRFLVSVAAPRTVLDSRFAATLPAARSGVRALQLNDKETLRFTPATIDMHGVADGIIGADVWGNRAVSIDYASGLVTYQKEGIHPELMTLFPFAAEPRADVIVDGRRVSAIIDTASPDTLTLPRGTAAAGRTKARVQLAGTDFGLLDVHVADVSEPRIGNRILSRFLLTIDYGKRVSGLWRDPRTL